MRKVSKRLFSVAIASALLALAGGAAQAATLSWHDEPIMGSNIDASVPGQFTVTVNGSPVVIPDSNTLPSQAVFVINPVIPCDGIHLCDLSSSVVAASSVNLDPNSPGHVGSSYAYVGHWVGPFTGLNNFLFPVDNWPATEFPIGELYSSFIGGPTQSGWYPEDAGNWTYTETWTGTAGDDIGASITSTRSFCLELATTPGACEALNAVPEPATLALLGLGLAGLGFGRRKRA